MNIEQWKTKVLMPLREYEGGETSSNLQPLLDKQVVELLAADTDRTQDYVFESVKLPEIRGASELLETLNRYQVPELFRQLGLPDECILAAEGGSLLALVPPGHAEPLARAVEQLYPERTGAATITCDWRAVTPRMILEGYPPEPGAFGSLVRWASGWLRRRKEDKQPGPFFEAPPHAVRCRSCKQRPAHKIYSYPDGEKWPICTVCYAKIEWIGRRPARWRWINEFDERLSDSQRQRYYASGLYTSGETAPPADLSQIGLACRARQGYVGLIYLDGDGMGEYMLNRPTPKAYHDTAKLLAEAAMQATVDALAANLQVVPGEGGPFHPFEIITVGGDDVVLIVPADVALPIAAQISEGFREKVAERLDEDEERLTMSAGVVIADDHNPVRVLLQLSKELLRSAKRARGGLEKPRPGVIDFHILLSQDMLAEKVGKVRRRFPYALSEVDQAGQPVDLRLLGRPYTAQQIQALWEAMQNLVANRFPRSQMHRLGEALLTGRRPSTLFYAYQKARRETSEPYRVLDGVIRTAWPLNDVTDPEPWFKLLGDPCYAYGTALWDIAELYDFVSKEE